MPPDPDDLFGLHESLRLVRAHVAAGPEGVAYDPLDATIAVCLDTVPAADAVALSYSGRGQVRSTHQTDVAVAEIDRLHRLRGRGPLLDEASDQPRYRSTAIVDDLAAVSPWVAVPGADLPLRSLHSTTLRSVRGRRTALDLYSTRPGAFGVDTTVLADMFAVRAATLLYGDGRVDAVRFELAVDVVRRRLGVGPAEAEILLLTHLRRQGDDPMTAAERLTDDEGRAEH